MLGMVVVVAAADADRVAEGFRLAGETVAVLGKITKAAAEPRVTFTGTLSS